MIAYRRSSSGCKSLYALYTYMISLQLIRRLIGRKEKIDKYFISHIIKSSVKHILKNIKLLVK